MKGLGYEVHHLFEKRFAGILGEKARNMLSIVIKKGEHQTITNKWRELIPYGKGTKGAEPKDVIDAAKKVYKEYPEILKELGL